MFLIYNRFFFFTIVYCINLLKAQPSFISIYVEYLLEKKFMGFDKFSFSLFIINLNMIKAFFLIIFFFLLYF